MKFFQNLSSVAKTAVAAASAQRHQESDQDYQLGMQLLLQAQQENFKNLASLKQASDHLLQAIRSNYRNPEPYIGMAYLLNLVEDYPTALHYLHEALRVDPGNQSAYSLQMAIQEQAKGADAGGKNAGVRVALHADDSDLAYDQLEDLLKREISLMSSFPPPEANPDAEHLLALEDQFDELNQNYQLIQTQLETLQEGLEMVSLHARLRPIETRLKQYEQVLRVSRRMHALREAMDQEGQSALCLSQYLVYQRPELAHQQLESTLDACDLLADALDLLEEKGTDIQTLKTDYRKLKTAVLHLQESIDEMKI